MKRFPPLRASSAPALLLILLLLIGLALRLIRLDFQPLWWDEGYSVWFAGHPLAEMARLTAQDIHPPLYYALLRAWTSIMGQTPVSLRLAGVLFSLAAIPLAYVLGRDLEDRPTGLIAAALVALNPLAIYYSQEIRMYGLATTFSLAALWTGWRWAQPQAKRRFGLAFALATLAGLYTLYYFVLLPLAQTVWALFFARGRLRQWIASLAAAAIFFLPWLLYAGPKLLDYVAYKIVKDNDTPLGLPVYAGRHLSAFVAGHLEGSLAPLWPWVLLLLIPIVVILAWPQRLQSAPGAEGSPARSQLRPLSYLLLALLIPLAVGFIQQLRAPFIPERFERVLLFAAPALWLLLAVGLRRLAREALAAAILVSALFAVVSLGSLAAFYTTPRYTGQDYRPLIKTVQANALPGDSVFTIFPWQTGYFWAYLSPDHGLAIVPSTDERWSSGVQDQLQDLLADGAVWFPEHLALGGILESQAETFLSDESYQLLNRWYGQETRLTGWAQAPQAASLTTLTAPVAWQNGVVLESATLRDSEDGRVWFDLAWSGEQAVDPGDLTFSLWLTGPEGYRWAQRDVSPFAHPRPPLDPGQSSWTNQDRIALTLPAGVPSGDYDMWAALLDATSLTPIPLAGANPAPQAWLGVYVAPIASPGRAVAVAHAQAASSQSVDFLGFDGDLQTSLPGDDLAVSLYWRPSASLDVDYFVFLQLVDDQDQVVAGLEGPPIPWLGTMSWPVGAPLRSQHRLRLPANVQPGRYQLIAGLFDPASGARLTWSGDDALRLGEVEVGARAHNYVRPTPQHELELTLDGGQQLIGYDLVAGDNPGSPVNLTLYWAPSAPTALRYSVFVHLLAPDDTILAQSDAEPAQGEQPTTAWLPGEYVTDAHTLTIPADAPAGPYRLRVGLYHPPTGQRLPFVDDEGDIIADNIILPLR